MKPRNKPQMLRWSATPTPSFNLQPLLLKRDRELEEAQAFNHWLGSAGRPRRGGGFASAGPPSQYSTLQLRLGLWPGLHSAVFSRIPTLLPLAQ